MEKDFTYEQYRLFVFGVGGVVIKYFPLEQNMLNVFVRLNTIKGNTFFLFFTSRQSERKVIIKIEYDEEEVDGRNVHKKITTNFSLEY